MRWQGCWPMLSCRPSFRQSASKSAGSGKARSRRAQAETLSNTLLYIELCSIFVSYTALYYYFVTFQSQWNIFSCCNIKNASFQFLSSLEMLDHKEEPRSNVDERKWVVPLHPGMFTFAAQVLEGLRTAYVYTSLFVHPCRSPKKNYVHPPQNDKGEAGTNTTKPLTIHHE